MLVVVILEIIIGLLGITTTFRSFFSLSFLSSFPDLYESRPTSVADVADGELGSFESGSALRALAEVDFTRFVRLDEVGLEGDRHELVAHKDSFG